MLTPHYTAIEYERRFLVTAAPNLPGPAIQITDRHLAGTRVYLRNARFPDGTVVQRLCKQYAADGTASAAIAIEELTPHDFALYAHMEANVIIKRRWMVAVNGNTVAIDVFSGPLQDLVLCEVAAAVEAEILGFVAPTWAPTEVTGEPFFAGGTLAFAIPDQLNARLATISA